MIHDTILHDRENNQETEMFLKSNGKKFSADCIVAMKLMYAGIRLNGETCKELYGIHDRRLRDCRAFRPDIVKSAWAKNAKGENIYVEFWIDAPHRPTKAEVIEKFHKAENNLKTVEENLSVVFSLPDDEIGFKQLNLFE